MENQHHDDKNELFALSEISRWLTMTAFDLDRLLDEIVKISAAQLHVKASALRLIDTETGDLILRAVDGLSQQFLSKGPTFDTDSRFCELIDNGGLYQSRDIRTDVDMNFSHAALQEGIVSLLAVGLFRDAHIIGALSVYTDELHTFSEAEIRTLRIIANQASVAVQLAQLHQVQIEKEWLERELALAAEIQAGILPKQMPTAEGFAFAGSSMPWEQIGGDFFDLIMLPEENLGIAIGDVSGKGLTAALLMFAVRTALRAHVEHEYAIREILSRVNRAVCRDTQMEQFATLFYGVLNVPTKTLTFVNAAQTPPLIFRGDKVLSLETGGLPVGLFPDEFYQEEAIQLEAGDVIVMYTDGFTDVLGISGKVFGQEDLCRLIRDHKQETPEQMIKTLEQDLSRFLDNSQYGDDRTMLVIKCE